MCTTKTPKVQQPVQKDPVYMANSWLDGLGINGESMGRNSLRIDMGTPAAHPITRPTFPPPNTGGGLGMGGHGSGLGGGGGGIRGGTRVLTN